MLEEYREGISVNVRGWTSIQPYSERLRVRLNVQWKGTRWVYVDEMIKVEEEFDGDMKTGDSWTCESCLNRSSYESCWVSAQVALFFFLKHQQRNAIACFPSNHEGFIERRLQISAPWLLGRLSDVCGAKINLRPNWPSLTYVDLSANMFYLYQQRHRVRLQDPLEGSRPVSSITSQRDIRGVGMVHSTSNSIPLGYDRTASGIIRQVPSQLSLVDHMISPRHFDIATLPRIHGYHTPFYITPTIIWPYTHHPQPRKLPSSNSHLHSLIQQPF